MNNLTIQDVKNLYANPMTSVLIATVRLMRSEAAKMRAKVDAYSQPILDAAGLTYEDSGQPITKLDDTWLCKDGPQLDAFFAALKVANHKHGFAHLGDRCPALVAESQARDAEAALIDHARDAFGIDRPIYNLDLRTRLLDLVMNPPRR